MSRRIIMVNPPVQAVSPWQLVFYAEPYPHGLLKLGRVLKDRGDEVHLIDMMEYDHFEPDYMEAWPHNVPVHSYKHAGGNRVADVVRPSYLLGRPMSYLRERLVEIGRPDEIWVTGCLTFNWETTHEAVAVAREVYPGAYIKLGGNYPTIAPEHARLAGADEIVVGKVEEAEWAEPDLTLYDPPPRIGVFNLATGCSNRCSFCINSRWEPTLRFQPEVLLEYLVRTRDELGVGHFANWDPNVMLWPREFEAFLDLMIQADTGITLSFGMGIQSNKVTEVLAEKMVRAGVTEMNVPFETSDPMMLRRFRKPYRFGAPIIALRRLRAAGFDLGRIHSTGLCGYDDEDPRFLFRSHAALMTLGVIPMPSPLTPVPQSTEWDRLHDSFAGKPLDELNGYLFPLLQSAEKVALYEKLVALTHQRTLEDAAALAAELPPELERIFYEEVDFVRDELAHDSAEPFGETFRASQAKVRAESRRRRAAATAPDAEAP